MKIIAHRGANRKYLENSWQAFHEAVRVGSDRIEFDVRMTYDDQLVVMHDTSTLRTAKTNHKVKELTHTSMRSIRLKNGERIPLLDQVLKKLSPEIELNIEIKSPGNKCVSKVIEMVNKQDKRKNIIISTFNPMVFRYLGQHTRAT